MGNEASAETPSPSVLQAWSKPAFEEDVFDVTQHRDRITAALEDASVASAYTSLVPAHLTPSQFWARYFAPLPVLPHDTASDLSRIIHEVRTDLQRRLEIDHSVLRRDTIGWGVIGLGDVVRRKSGPALSQTPGSFIAAVCSRSIDTARAYATEHGVRFYTTSVAALLSHPDVDIVYIATPPSSHHSLALQVAAAQKPCLIEKPFACTAWEALHIVEAFGRVPVYVCHYRRSQHRWRVVKALLEDGHLGDLTAARIVYAGTPPAADGWRQDPAVAGGGLLMDLGPHQLDLLVFLLGPLSRLQSVVARRPVGAALSPVETSVQLVGYAGDVPIAASWDFGGVEEDQLTIRGARARLDAPVFGSGITITYTDGTSVRLDDTPPTPHTDLIRDIVNQHRGAPGWHCPATAAAALHVARALDAMLSS